mmetsp:Transcript_1470/g.2103  ORF Transcript_1470/g.2103 Transcript_1470/m.2103 type:complete len:263 (-) Transcript_1470:595-1383(-)
MLRVLTSNTSQDSEGDGDKGPDEEYDDDSSKRQCGSGAVSDGHCVKKGKGEQHRPAEKRAGHEHIAHPVGSSTHLLVVGSRCVARDAGCQGVQHDDCSEKRAAVVRIEDPDECKDKNAENHGKELGARADHRAEQVYHGREAEYISMNVFPSSLFLLISSVVVTTVLYEIILQHPHQNCCKETCKQKYCDARIYYRKPMDFKMLREERVTRVLFHSSVKRDSCFLPAHGKRKIHTDLVFVGDVQSTHRVSRYVYFNYTFFVI